MQMMSLFNNGCKIILLLLQLSWLQMKAKQIIRGVFLANEKRKKWKNNRCLRHLRARDKKSRYCLQRQYLLDCEKLKRKYYFILNVFLCNRRRSFAALRMTVARAI